jgi:acetylornithine deacetylase/succinyl-diaminopimelate desuccinylase-like protein
MSDSVTATRLLDAIERSRAVTFATEITSLSQPDGREGPRAVAMADLMDHPRLDIHVDPALPGRPNVIVRLRGTGDAPGLLLNGHIDAGYVPDGWSGDPLDPWEEGGRLYGGAISDMLGGVASMMEALVAAASLPPLPGDLVLLANMHHDSNGLGTKYALTSDGDWPAYGINGEPTSMSILTVHGGCVKFQVELRGRVAHISRAEEGIDALAAAVEVHRGISRLAWTHEPHGDLPQLPRVLVGVLDGGFAPAAVADRAILQGDIRTVPGQSWQTVRADIEALVAETCPPDVSARVSCLVRQRPFIGPKSGALMDALSAAHRRVRGAPVEVDVDSAAQSFVTDAVDMAQAGIETLIYGPAAWHFAPDESIDIDEMTDAARVYLATAAALMGLPDR